MRQLDSNMDPTHHEKIVDKLMQYRGKIPKTGHIGDLYSRTQCEAMRTNIDNLILMIEVFAKELNQELI